MNTPVVPSTYDEWKHCILVECGLALDDAYIAQRIAALEDTANFHTSQFIRCWSDAHRRRVLEWFRQARQDAGMRRTP